MAAYAFGLFTIAGLTLEDFREKKLSLWKIVVSGTLALIYAVSFGNFSFLLLALSAMPGIWLLVLAVLTKERIGYGDGLAVISLGLWTGVLFTVYAVCTGLLIAGIYAFICLLTGKKDVIPFMPFLLLGMEVVLLYVN